MQTSKVWSIAAITVVVLIICAIAFKFMPSCEVSEPFLGESGLQSQLSFETIEKRVLQEYAVFDGVTLDESRLTRILSKMSKSIGQSGFYAAPSANKKEFIESVFATRHRHAAMASQFYGLVVGIVHDAGNDSTSYLAVEKPWDLSSTVLADSKYHIACSGCRLYIPKWSYSKMQPSTLTIPDSCVTIVNKWRDSGDADAIKELEKSACLSRENKIRFVGSIILTYLRLLEGSNWNMKKACLQYEGMLSNVQNPEVQQLMSQLNGVCSKVDIVDDDFNTDLDPGCIKAYNSWMLDGREPKESKHCFTYQKRTLFLKRLRAFMEIGSQVPDDYIDAYYRVVSLLYDVSHNKKIHKVFERFREQEGSPDNWKKVLDTLVQDYIKPHSVVVNGKKSSGGSLDSKPLVIDNVVVGNSVIVEMRIPHVYRLRTIILKGCHQGQLTKFSIVYEDPYVPGKFTDFDRVLYGVTKVDEIKVNSLDGIVTNHLRILPLDWTGKLALKVGFEGHSIQLDKCAQMMSVCKHKKALDEERSAYTQLQYKLNDKVTQLAENNSSIVQLSDRVEDLQKQVQAKAREADINMARKCPPAPVCVTPIALQPVWPTKPQAPS